MRKHLVGGIVVAAFLQSLTGCSVRYRVAHMIARVDAMPAEERPAEWDRTKALLLREAPKVGEPAPPERFAEYIGTEALLLGWFGMPLLRGRTCCVGLNRYGKQHD
ncbi:MAG: hypothetical protein IID33_12835 [Planctomycetes bacterium]|nr:hypothetical protein [Planctomycetota bacterium]